MGQCLTLEHLGDSAIVTLSGPPANLLTLECLRELAGQMNVLEHDSAVRAVVITGAGNEYFSSGLDLSALAEGGRDGVEQWLDALFQAFNALRQFKGVTVAAVNGYALGAGLECALSCDYIVAEKGACLGMPQTRVGLIPLGGGAKLLVDKVGEAWCKRLVLGGDLLDAVSAHRIGLVEECAEPGLAKIVALSLANKVAAQGPMAVREARRLICGARAVTFEAHMQAVREAIHRLIGGEEQVEGLAAFLEKRSPPWSPDNGIEL